MITERQLQDDCIRAIACHEEFPRKMASCGYSVVEPTDDHKKAAEIAIHRGLIYLGQNRTARHGGRVRREFLGSVAAGIERDSKVEDGNGKNLCGFGFIFGAFLSWLIGKALEYLWQRYTHDDDLPALCGLVAGIAS